MKANSPLPHYPLAFAAIGAAAAFCASAPVVRAAAHNNHHQPQPDFLWADSFTGASPWAIASDPPRHCVYVAGGFAGTNFTVGGTTLPFGPASENMFLIKCDEAGHALWAKAPILRDPGAIVEALGVGVDRGGNVYVAATFGCSSAILDGVTISNSPEDDLASLLAKFDHNGRLVWAKRLEASVYDPQFFSVDESGGFYISDLRSGNTIRFDGDGNAAWSVPVVGTVVPDSKGTLYLSTGIIGPGPLFKFDSAGNLLWQKDIGLPVPDKAENFYSWSTPSARDQSASLSKYDGDGGLLWTRAALVAPNGDYSGSFSIVGASTDHAGNILVAGQFDSAFLAVSGITLANSHPGPGNNDFFAAKFDDRGSLLWAQSGGPDIGVVAGVAADHAGNAYAAGTFLGSSATFGDFELTGSLTTTFLTKIGEPKSH